MESIKKLSAVLLVAYAVSVLSACSPAPEDKIVGEWSGTDSTGKTASFVFNEDRTAKMIEGNVVLDGNSVGGSIEWELDDSQNPMHLDLVLTKNSGESKRLPMIIRFVGENKIQLKKSRDFNSRPIEFSESNDRMQMVLTKQ